MKEETLHTLLGKDRPSLAVEAQQFENNMRTWMTSLVGAMDTVRGEREDYMFGRSGTVEEFLTGYEMALQTSGLGETPVAARCVELSVAGAESVFGGNKGGIIKASNGGENEFPELSPELDYSENRQRAAVLFSEALKLRVQDNRDVHIAVMVSQILKPE